MSDELTPRTDPEGDHAAGDFRRKTLTGPERRTDSLPPLPLPPDGALVDGTIREHELNQAVKRQTDQLEAINNVITAAIQSPNLKRTLQTALSAALSVIPVEASGISLIDEAAGELVMWAQLGWKQDLTSTPMRIKVGEGMSGLVVKLDQVLITGDPSRDSRLVVPAFADEDVKAMVLMPMHSRGKVIGVLSVMSRTPYHFSEGEVATLRVIADQVGLALDNAQLYESMRAQQSRLEAVLNSTADAIIATDDKGIINLVNQTAETLFEVRAADMIGRPLRESPFWPDLRERLQKAIIDAGPDSPSRGRSMVEGRTMHGRYLLGFVSPVYSVLGLQENPRDAWVAVFQDITHIKEAEMARVQFIQTAAHEMRNPLGVTLSALSMLNTSLNPTPADQEIFDIALRGLNRLQDLIDDLLDLEKIEAGADIRFEPIDIPELIERCVIDMRPVLARKHQDLLVAIDAGLPLFNGDARWLYRALTNLVSNAHKYTPNSTKVTIRAQVRNKELVLSVEDNGPGIPKDVQRRLFERFYRARRTEDKVTGTGLGLSIVKSVAERHQGRAFVRSELPLFSTLWANKGSTFGLIMPFREVPNHEEGSGQQ